MIIQVLRAGALGDAVLTLPLFRSLRENFPDAEISVTGSSYLIDLLAKGPWADSFRRLEDPSLNWLFSEGGPPPGRGEMFRGASYVFLLIEDARLFRKLDSLCPGRVFTAERTANKMHAADRILSVLPRIGITSFSNIPLVYASEEDEVFAEDFLKSRGLIREKLAAVHPGSGSRGKNWPAGRFAGAGKKIARDYGMRVIVPAGEADEESSAEFLRHFGEGAVPAAGLTLGRLAALLGRCGLYIGNDSGVSHLAAARGVPSVCVFGPTDPGTWAPRGKNVRVVYTGYPCSPCSRDERNLCRKRGCLLGASVSDVYSEAEDLLR